MEVSVAQLQEQIVQVDRVIPRRRPCERIEEQIMGFAVPQVVDEAEVVAKWRKSLKWQPSV